jgi:hypothetical protein
MEETEQPNKSDIFDIFSLEQTLPTKRNDIQSFWGKQILRKNIIENTVLEETNKEKICKS